MAQKENHDVHYDIQHLEQQNLTARNSYMFLAADM
jgi:hypothetical protein